MYKPGSWIRDYISGLRMYIPRPWFGTTHRTNCLYNILRQNIQLPIKDFEDYEIINLDDNN